MLQRIWNGSCEDWLHGDEYLDDADDYAPMEPVSYTHLRAHETLR